MMIHRIELTDAELKAVMDALGSSERKHLKRMRKAREKNMTDLCDRSFKLAQLYAVTFSIIANQTGYDYEKARKPGGAKAQRS